MQWPLFISARYAWLNAKVASTYQRRKPRFSSTFVGDNFYREMRESLQYFLLSWVDRIKFENSRCWCWAVLSRSISCIKAGKVQSSQIIASESNSQTSSSPVKRSNNWATWPGLRWQTEKAKVCILPLRMCDTRTANTAVSICLNLYDICCISST